MHSRDQILAVLGNHDVFDGNSPSVIKSILNAEVILLENTVYTLHRNGATLHIAGVGDVWAKQARLDLVLDRMRALPLIYHSRKSKMDESSVNPKNKRYERRDRQRQSKY